MNSTKSSMIGMKPKDAIKLETVQLDKTYPEENVLPEDGLYTYLYNNLVNNMETKKDERQTLSGLKLCID